MDLETLESLLSPEGEQLLKEARALEGSLLSRITALRKRYPADLVSAAVEMVELRRRAARKFSLADRMFFTREALEQASSEVISAYRAERFLMDSRVLDLGCGIGGDTIGLARRCFVTAVDREPDRIAMAERNLEVYGLRDHVELVCADVTEIELRADAAFLDPSRRVGGRRVVRLSELGPSVEFIHRLLQAIPDCAVKLSPATDYPELEALGGEVEFISESGECKEALVWFGGFNTASRRATILPEKTSLVYAPVKPVPVRQPGRYLYEPDACVIRAHLVEHIAWEIHAWKIDDRIAYLSSDALTDTPFADAYEVIESLPFNLRELKRRLGNLGAGRVIVKKRGVAFEPREMEERLKGRGDGVYILVLTRVAGRPWAFICKSARPAGSATTEQSRTHPPSGGA